MKFELLKKNSSYSINAYNQNYFVVFHYINYNNILISTDIESNTKMYFPLEDIVSINESFSKIDLEINSIQNSLFEAVFSKKELKENYLKFSNKAALIVISNPDNNSFKKLNYFNDELYLSFFDTENNGFYSNVPAQSIIALKEFILNNIHTKFVVCCEAGVSRSAGIAKAIEKLSGKEIGSIDSFPRYRPNTLLFKKLIK